MTSPKNGSQGTRVLLDQPPLETVRPWFAQPTTRSGPSGSRAGGVSPAGTLVLPDNEVAQQGQSGRDLHTNAAELLGERVTPQPVVALRGLAARMATRPDAGADDPYTALTTLLDSPEPTTLLEAPEPTRSVR